MGARFGANVNTGGGWKGQSSKKLVLLIASLVLVLLLLMFVAVVVMLKQGSSENVGAMLGAGAKGKAEDPNSQLTGLGTATIFITRQRIEDGEMIDPDTMLRTEDIDMANFRPNMFQANQRQQLTGAYWTRTTIFPDTPLLEDYVTKNPPTSAFKIPPGFRAVTITVDSRKGVEGWARPNSRVDVLFTYKDPKTTKTTVHTIVSFVRVLSVGGQNQTDGQGRVKIGNDTTITLLVEENDAKKIELARAQGEISLILAGENAATGNVGTGGSAVTLNDLIGGVSKGPDEPEQIDGRMVVEDPKTKKKRVYVLIKGRWLDKTDDYDQ